MHPPPHPHFWLSRLEGHDDQPSDVLHAGPFLLCQRACMRHWSAGRHVGGWRQHAFGSWKGSQVRLLWRWCRLQVDQWQWWRWAHRLLPSVHGPASPLGGACAVQVPSVWDAVKTQSLEHGSQDSGLKTRPTPLGRINLGAFGGAVPDNIQGNSPREKAPWEVDS